MIKPISFKSQLVYKNTVAGYRCTLTQGNLIDIDADLVTQAAVNIPQGLPQEQLFKHSDGRLLTKSEIENNLYVADGSKNPAILKWLKRIYS